MTDAHVALIGAGNIAKAIVTGLVADGYNPGNITACDPDKGQLEKFADLGVNSSQSNQEGIADAEVIILSVKPTLMKTVCLNISETLGKHQLLISVAAGITTTSIENWTNPDAAIIRCMPNTPALVRQGITVLFGNIRVEPSQRKLAEHLLGSVGTWLWIEDEALMDVVTAVSGSGPAYFFLVMEAMEKAAIKLGLEQEVAQKLVRQTALGAAEMVNQGISSPEQLRKQVTSPGGTTEAAIGKLLGSHLIESFDGAIEAAFIRSVQLSKT